MILDAAFTASESKDKTNMHKWMMSHTLRCSNTIKPPIPI